MIIGFGASACDVIGSLIHYFSFEFCSVVLLACLLAFMDIYDMIKKSVWALWFLWYTAVSPNWDFPP